MSLPSRAAAIRGDNYQHAIGWHWACKMLCDPDAESIMIEDPNGGAFDDVTVRRRNGKHVYIQAKSSNYGNVIVDEDWLFRTTSDAERSPLQRFHATYTHMAASGESWSLELWTNRGFDHQNPILGSLLDNKHERVNVAALAEAGPGSNVGKARKRWADHLGVTPEALVEFLAQVRWVHRSVEAIRESTASAMELAGLRWDENAVDLGGTIASAWVTDGAGPRTVDHIRLRGHAHGLDAASDGLFDAPCVPRLFAARLLSGGPGPCRQRRTRRGERDRLRRSGGLGRGRQHGPFRLAWIASLLGPATRDLD